MSLREDNDPVPSLSTHVHQVHGEHAKMLVEEVYPAFIDAFCNVFPNLVRTPTLDHVQPCPSIFCLGSAGRSHKQGVLELPLEVVLLHMVGKGCGHLSRRVVVRLIDMV